MSKLSRADALEEISTWSNDDVLTLLRKVSKLFDGRRTSKKKSINICLPLLVFVSAFFIIHLIIRDNGDKDDSEYFLSSQKCTCMGRMGNSLTLATGMS